MNNYVRLAQFSSVHWLSLNIEYSYTIQLDPEMCKIAYFAFLWVKQAYNN